VRDTAEHILNVSSYMLAWLVAIDRSMEPFYQSTLQKLSGRRSQDPVIHPVQMERDDSEFQNI
jgi:hypothetical protein